MMPWELEDWLTDSGDRVLHRTADFGWSALSEAEQLIHSIWVLDTEIRNGGLSQYFLNRGVDEWRRLRELSRKVGLLSFESFASHVDQMILASDDPYSAIQNAPDDFDEEYYAMQEHMIGEVRNLLENR